MIYAKSDGTTLIEHIEDCIAVFKELKKALPLLKKVTDLDNFWDLLFCAIYFHDFGKAHLEFQKYLKEEKSFWQNQRHEVYSIPFVDKLDIKDNFLIKLVILTHHKIIPKLLEKHYLSQDDLDQEFNSIWKDKLKFHPKDFEQNIRRKFVSQDLAYLLNEFEKYKKENKVKISILKKTISLKNLEHPVKEIAKPLFNKKYIGKEYFQKMFMWGALKICDHFGSGRIKRIFTLKSDHFEFLDKMGEKFKNEKNDFYSHQKKCFKISGSCLLIAPTGSGKTEAAIGWLKKQIEQNQGRFFYILPYTASINAMHKRLSRCMDKSIESPSKIIGIQHGNLSHYISDYFEQGESITDNIERNKKIKKVVEQYRQIIAPVNIGTPFQVLKYLYGVKGFEKGLTFLCGAKLVFDEIHAYDVVTFAQIIVMLGFLRKNFLCEVMIMTATLPTFMINELKKTIEVNEVICSDKILLKNLKRHKINIYNGNIFDSIHMVEDFIFDNKRVIIACNTVKNAQEIYWNIKKMEICCEDEIVLLHGRFNQHDRNRKEGLVFDDKIKILIGTQAIEVSLDIDYDVMITEPAPLDALLQRFGRINRNAKKELSPIYICDESGKSDHFIYSQDVVKKTLNELSKVEILQEDTVKTMLDNVYPGWSEKEEKEFEDTKLLFRSSLESIQPFADCTGSEESFYEQFTNIKVLPAVFYSQYKQLMENFNFIEAEKLLVNISKKFFSRYKAEGRIEIKYVDLCLETGKIKKESFYLVKSKYSSEIGLTDDYEDTTEIEFI